MNEIDGTGDTGSSPFVATGLSVSLTVRDLGASVAWYRDALGFAVERQFEREGRSFAARLCAGPVALLLTQDDGARGPGRVKGEGLSLRLTTEQDVDALADRVRSRGVTLESGPFEAWGMRAFRVRDPDGFLLVISSEPPETGTRG
jgi:catechol 2,3-dioxygenase-like lactoylglutathione lyase family enzyme